MSNHCVYCEICGDCLRCNHGNKCDWNLCPVMDDRKDFLKQVALNHPSKELREKAKDILKKEKL